MSLQILSRMNLNPYDYNHSMFTHQHRPLQMKTRLMGVTEMSSEIKGPISFTLSTKNDFNRSLTICIENTPTMEKIEQMVNDVYRNLGNDRYGRGLFSLEDYENIERNWSYTLRYFYRQDFEMTITFEHKKNQLALYINTLTAGINYTHKREHNFELFNNLFRK